MGFGIRRIGTNWPARDHGDCGFVVRLSPRENTGRYATGPTIPGPTLVMKEGDTAEVTLEHGIADLPQPVSIHVHGVHYKIDSDGTMKMMNGVADEAAFPGKPYTYKWTAAPGTAGTWMYHDHTFGNPIEPVSESHLSSEGKSPSVQRIL